MRLIEDADDLVKHDGKILIRNTKGNMYFVKNVKPDKHTIVKQHEYQKYLKSGKTGLGGKKGDGDTEGIDMKIVSAKPLTKEVRDKIAAVIVDNIEKAGLKVGYRKIFGRTYLIGLDDLKNKTIYDWDGKKYDYQEFFDIERDRRKTESKLNRIHNISLYLSNIKKESIESIDKLIEDEEVTYEFMTDDKVLQRRLTRSYPVVTKDGRRIIVGGRFKGYNLDDMINRAGRQLAGTGYVLGDDGIPRAIEYKSGNKVKFRVESEPYLTKTPYGQYKLILPSWDKTNRNKIVDLAKTYKSIKFTNKERTSISINIDDFDSVNEALGGLSMSQSASTDILARIAKKKRLREVELNRDYEHISTKTIEGMRTERNGKSQEFMAHQKKAITVVDDRKGNTVIGLDTGTGKTATTVGIIQKWLNDGTLRRGRRNGRALIVTPASLKGNFPAQIREWTTDSSKVKNKVDVISYGEFSKNPNKYKKYGAVFFDEAQKMRTMKSKISKAALAFNHPIKVPLTASVLEKSPMDLFTLTAIAKNQAKDPKVFRAEAQKFVRTFCNKVGGKVIGLKENPTTKRKFREWVRENTLYIDKTDVVEMPLPPITPTAERTQNIQMEPSVKKEYTKMTRPIRDTMKRMTEKYRNKELKTSEINQELSRVMGEIQKLRSFLNNPDDFVKGARNPKVDWASDQVGNILHKNDSAKTITWTDTPSLAEKAALNLSIQYVGKKHVVCLAGEIAVYQNGKKVESYGKTSKLSDSDGNPVPSDEWQVHLVNKLQRDRDVSTMNMTSAYTTGHNIQSVQNILHLDRDSWNNENMKQRDARAWRSGQKHPVSVAIADLVSDDGESLDTIQKYSMEIEQGLFDELIKKSANIDIKDTQHITDFQQLLKNKESLQYLTNPSLFNSKEIK